MANPLAHEIELYPFGSFKTLLNHEVNRAKRYKDPVTLLHLVVETDSSEPNAKHAAELFTINTLNVHLRDTDIPCRQGNEFLVLMPATDAQGGRVVCERLGKLFHTEAQIYDKVSFKLFVFIGMTTLSGEDTSLTSHKLLEEALTAMQIAHAQRMKEPVIYSEIANM